jgi:hypothetical protein
MITQVHSAIEVLLYRISRGKLPDALWCYAKLLLHYEGHTG